MTLEELMPRISGDKAASYYIANVLREAIYRGILRDGEQLLQNQLAARMGVSPIPLREALKQIDFSLQKPSLRWRFVFPRLYKLYLLCKSSS